MDLRTGGVRSKASAKTTAAKIVRGVFFVPTMRIIRIL